MNPYAVFLAFLLPSAAFIAWGMLREYRATVCPVAHRRELRRIRRARALRTARAR